MKDVLLNSMVNLSNSIGLSMNITLNVQGTMISGTLISYEKYLKTAGDSFKESRGNGGKLLSDFFDNIRNEVAATKVEDDDDSIDADYIHLENARIISGKNDFELADVWRGKIESIDGFFFGKTE